MRRTFADELLKRAKLDKRIVVVTMDLGYKLWDQFRDELPDQFYNVGAAEQAGLDICVGLALAGKVPFAYTITSFYWRAAETIRLYIDHEKIPVVMVGSGRDKNYAHDGFSHDASDAPELFGLFPNVKQFYPLQLTSDHMDHIINSKQPCFISLTR